MRVCVALVVDAVPGELAGVDGAALCVAEGQVQTTHTQPALQEAGHGVGYDPQHGVHDHAGGAAKHQHVARSESDGAVWVRVAVFEPEIRRQSDGKGDDGVAQPLALPLGLLTVLVPLEGGPRFVEVDEQRGGVHGGQAGVSSLRGSEGLEANPFELGGEGLHAVDHSAAGAHVEVE